MPVDIENYFKATAQSSWNFLITNGQGCYIPGYQRPYSWDSDNVDRLFEDAIHGLAQLEHRPDTISFLGSVIAIHDTRYKTVKPIFRQEVASRVMTIIDGQQRICTFVMANVAIHNELLRFKRKFDGKDQTHFSWLADQAAQLAAALQDSFVIDMRTGEANYQFYPRVIRAFEDVWSRKASQAVYTSPIARLAWDYFVFAREESKKTFRFNPLAPDGKVPVHYKPMSDVFRHIQRKLKQIIDEQSAELGFPSLRSAVRSVSFNEAIWGFELPDEVRGFVLESGDQALYKDYTRLLRLLIFSRYLNDRMAFTVVTTESEDDAFDMFEALNTTGEPLTAFETFKPKVLETEGITQYEGSPSFKLVRDIEGYLERFKKAEQKQRATSEMLIPFALAETGERLPKKLNDQRRYLREQYDGSVLADLPAKRAFLARIADTANYLNYAWDAESDASPSILFKPLPDGPTAVGFAALIDMKHDMTIAPIIRFIERARLATERDKEQKFNDLVDAIRATVAFSVIWRAAKGTTANIDSIFREIVRAGLGNALPLAERPKDSECLVTLDNYRRSLTSALSQARLDSKEQWVRFTAKTPIYTASKPVARYLLFLASHDADLDPNFPGLIIRGRSGLCPLLDLTRWKDRNYLTVEHIAPQAISESWPEELYEDPDVVHRLGNLILLPAEENAMIANRSWLHKRALYKLLAAGNETIFEQAKADCSEIGLTLSHKATEVLNNASYLGLCNSLARKPDDWSAEFIELRSERIASLAWDRLAPWLNLLE